MAEETKIKDEFCDEVLEYFGEECLDDYEMGEQEDQFENYRKNIVTTIAFLLGVADDKFGADGVFDIEEYNKIKENESAIIIRYLCRLRTQFLRNYKSIDDERKYQMRLLESMSEYLDIDAITYLRRKEIEINVSSAKNPSYNIAYINQYILDNLEKIKSLIPDWVNFQYVKSIFLMPGGYAGHNGNNLKGNSSKKIFSTISSAGKEYASQRYFYPFQMYLNWPVHLKESDGNVLYNDLKFLKKLYAACGDQFSASRYVIDAKSDTKEGFYEFVSEALNVAIFVDCENVDPYAFGAMILNLDPEQLVKIKKIVLYDDLVNTSSAWKYIADIMNIPVVRIGIERLLENKSLVDIRMALGVYEEYRMNNMESIILASSDSDFWGLIQHLPDARFLVLNEYQKTSHTIIEQLDKNNIKHCFMTDFAQDSIQRFKSDVLYLGLASRIKEFNSTGHFSNMNVNKFIRDIFYEADINGADNQVKREKDAFFDKYLKNGLLIKPVNENGELVFKIEVYRK